MTKSTIGYVLEILEMGFEINFLSNKSKLNSSHTVNINNKIFHVPKLFLIENLTGKSSINIEQVRNMINYANKTAYNNKKKFILINNSEFLNLNSINALLKIVEEPGSNTNFILIHNSSNIISYLSLTIIHVIEHKYIIFFNL